MANIEDLPLITRCVASYSLSSAHAAETSLIQGVFLLSLHIISRSSRISSISNTLAFKALLRWFYSFSLKPKPKCQVKCEVAVITKSVELHTIMDQLWPLSF